MTVIGNSIIPAGMLVAWILIQIAKEEKPLDYLKPVGMIFLVMLPICFLMSIKRFDIAMWLTIIFVLLCSSDSKEKIKLSIKNLAKLMTPNLRPMKAISVSKRVEIFGLFKFENVSCIKNSVHKTLIKLSFSKEKLEGLRKAGNEKIIKDLKDRSLKFPASYGTVEAQNVFVKTHFPYEKYFIKKLRIL